MISSRFVCVWNVHDDFFSWFVVVVASREFFIFQIADVHLLHSATWWRLLGQKYSLTTEVTRLRLRGERVAVWCGNEIEPHYGRVAQTTGSQTKRERSPFAARSSQKIGPKCCTLVRFRAAATGDRSRSGTWATRPYLGCYNMDYPSASNGGVCTSKFPRLLRGLIFSPRSVFPRRRFLQTWAPSTGARPLRSRSPDSCRPEKKRGPKPGPRAREAWPLPAWKRDSTA